MIDLIERLRSGRHIDNKPGNPESLRAPSATDLRAADEIERLRDKVEGLDADLRCAVQTAYNRGATEWARLNYRDMIPWLESQATQPPTDRKEA